MVIHTSLGLSLCLQTLSLAAKQLTGYRNLCIIYEVIYMRLNISSLVGKKGAFLKVEREVSGEFLRTAPEINRVLEPVFVKLLVTNTGEGFLVTGDLSAEVEILCSRCLRPFKTVLETSVTEEFTNQPEEEENELWGEQLVVDGTELDITSLIEESLLVSIPMKSICREDCAGLCPTCGVLLSEGSCDCLDPTIDIRLASLSKLLQLESETTTPERRKDHGSSKEKTFKSKSK